ncbi:competence protein CoiA [Formosa sp. Hel1_33_131]|nr:competence protein CoiA [Formosa sp. Hel1_33_131]
MDITSCGVLEKRKKVLKMDNEFYEPENYHPIKDWAKICATNKPIHANEAKKSDGPFYCPDTFEELIVRKCVDKRDHFAYKGRLSSVYGGGESKLHFECKTEICEELKKEFPDGNWKVERLIPENKEKDIKKLTPDISGRINGKPIVIEVQASSLTLPKILKRVNGYYARKVSILWIVPLKEDLGTENFRPRLYEKYLHSMYYGKVYYWIKGNGSKVSPVHFDNADRWIEESHWFEEDGTERTEGGFDKTYKTIFKPNYGKKIDLKDFISYEREEFTPENEDKTVPKCLIFKDNMKKWWKGK